MRVQTEQGAGKVEQVSHLERTLRAIPFVCMVVNTLKRSVVLVAAAAAVLCLATPTMQGVVLRRTLAPGTKDVYSVVANVKQTIGLGAVGMGDQEMTMKSTSTLSLLTTKVDAGKGTADVEIVTTDMKVEMGGMADMMGDPTANLPKEVRIKGVMNPLNKFTTEPVKPGPDAMMMTMVASAGTATQFFELPVDPIEIGDSWDVLVPKNPTTGGQETKLKATLKGERKEKGVDVWVITLEGTIAMDLNMDEMMKANPEMAGGAPISGMKVTGNLVVKAEALLEKAGCRTVSVTSEVKTKAKTEIPDMGMTMDMDGVTTSTMVLRR